MILTNLSDYVIAILGILIIAVGFIWNIYDVFIHKSAPHSETSQSEDSTIR